MRYRLGFRRFFPRPGARDFAGRSERDHDATTAVRWTHRFRRLKLGMTSVDLPPIRLQHGLTMIAAAYNAVGRHGRSLRRVSQFRGMVVPEDSPVDAGSFRGGTQLLPTLPVAEIAIFCAARSGACVERQRVAHSVRLTQTDDLRMIDPQRAAAIEARA